MSNEGFQAIAREMIAMSEADQAMRKSGVWDASIDVKHTARMQQIVAEIGWPTISKVGVQASQMVWLLSRILREQPDEKKNHPPMEKQPRSREEPAALVYCT